MDDDNDATVNVEAALPSLDEKRKGSASSKSRRRSPSLSKFLSLAKPESRMLLLAFFLMVASEAASLYNPILLADAYNAVIDPFMDSSDRMSEINHTMTIVVVIHFAGVVADFVHGSIMSVAGERIVARLRNKLFSSLLHQEVAFYDEHKTGELVSRLGSDTTLIQQATSSDVPQVILGIVKLLVSVGLMFWISPSLAGITMGTVSAVCIVCIPFGKLIGSLSESYQDVLGEAQTRSTEALGSMRTVQSFAAEDKERRRYGEKVGDPDAFRYWFPVGHKKHKTTYSLGFFQSIANTGFYTCIWGFGFGALYISLWYGFKLVNEGEISLGQLTAFESYIFQIGFGLGSTSQHLVGLLEGLGVSGRIFELLDRVPSIPSRWYEDEGDSTMPLKPLHMEGTVEFRNVSFSYPSRPGIPVVVGFSLNIKANTTAALVGSSGSGKSTIVSLLQRFYEVNCGSIMIDGKDIRALDLKWLRSHTGYVQQEPQLFGLTVRENVCYGVDREVTKDEMEAACKEANAHDFIMSWPKQYDTLVGERGVQLSGGQKQRIAIARALLVNPRILLLDEATSALDAESEHMVQEAIDKAVVGRTVLIVAHRLSTIKQADQIVVMDEHRIDDVGTHEELLTRCGKYQDLIKRQSLLRNDVVMGSASVLACGSQVDWEGESTTDGGYTPWDVCGINW